MNHTRRTRSGLTLIELVVVIGILVALSGMIIPIVQGLGTQTNAATNATVVDDVNRTLGMHATRFETQPAGWDSLLNTSHTMFTKVHQSLQAASPAIVQPVVLSDEQIESLARAGIYSVRDATEGNSSSPNLNNETVRTLAVMNADGKILPSGEDKTLLCLTMTTNPSGVRLPVLDAAFRVNQYQDGDATNEFVVLGLGQWSSMQGAAAMQVPLVQSADPTHNYARICCVYMIPSSSSAVFPARYVGCFLPDGTTARDNMSKYNNSDN